MRCVEDADWRQGGQVEVQPGPRDEAASWCHAGRVGTGWSQHGLYQGSRDRVAACRAGQLTSHTQPVRHSLTLSDPSCHLVITSPGSHTVTRPWWGHSSRPSSHHCYVDNQKAKEAANTKSDHYCC